MSALHGHPRITQSSHRPLRAADDRVRVCASDSVKRFVEQSISAMTQHVPVLLDEVLAALELRVGGVYLDATFGRGGHTSAILEKVGESGRVIAIDRDPQAITAGRARFAQETRLTLVSSAFSKLESVAAGMGLTGGLNGVLLDLGVSSPQLDDAQRGFSFAQDGPLDMRMNNAAGEDAAHFIARVTERDLTRIIRDYGEERFAKRIARAIVEARAVTPITRTAQLAQIVATAHPAWEPGKHPATRTFQAIRIHINDEFAEIQSALEAALAALAPGGRLCVISFHSLEDGIVKRFIQTHSQDDPVYAGLPQIPADARAKLRRVGKPVHPSEAEVQRNPRSRSAILRVAERVAA